MEEFKRLAVEQLGIEPVRIPIVILAAVGIYFSFLLLVKCFGVRVLAKMTAYDAVVIVMFGAVAGRVIVGNPPSLAAGVIGLATLMLLESTFGQIRRIRGVRRTFDTRPQIVLVRGHVIKKQLRKVHLSPSDLRMAIRRKGISRLSQVQLVILEPTGELSIFKEGEPIEPKLLRGVAGTDCFEEGDSKSSESSK